jgi:glucosamine-6-phosphate deaminase
MDIHIFPDPATLGNKAGSDAAFEIREVLASKDQAAIIIATGSSQFKTLETLISSQDIDWSRVILFHLDEYIGLPESHAASFRKYIRARFLHHLPGLTQYYLIDGEKNIQEELNRLNQIIQNHPIDLALVGIGENGHLAFNDPPANFETKEPYIVVNLDNACRQQQVNEGWFATIQNVPAQAISMSIHQILLSRKIICSVPDARKAVAVRNTVQEPISPFYPATALRLHTNCSLYLDAASARLIH